jgi:TonB family protein
MTQEVDPREEPTPARPGLAPEMPFALSHVVVAAPALLVEARFRDIPLASRLLRADETRAFTIGAARGADAPVNPAYLPPSPTPMQPAPFVEPTPGGFAVNLAPAMRAELLTPSQALPLRPDFGHAEAPLMLPADACLRVSCGEVAFDIFAAEPAAVVPPPRFAAGLREHGRYTLGVGLAFLALLLVVRAIPEDPRSLSLDDIGRSGRMVSAVVIPLDINSPEVDKALASKEPGGGGSKAAKGEQGKAGDKNSKRQDGRRAVAGKVDPKDARDAAGEIRKNTLLAVLDGPMTGSAAEVFEHRAALGPDMETVLGNLQGTTIANAYGVSGLGQLGTGAGGGGTNEGTIGFGHIGTRGKFGDRDGPGSGNEYGAGMGKLRTRAAKTPDPMIGTGTVKGQLDKEIIRRIVRRHVNEVRYCYEQALARQPKLDGRLVTQFTISGNGTVIASVISSSTLRSPAVESCVVNAIRRWEFPAPTGHGLAIVSYPFTFTPAGN